MKTISKILLVAAAFGAMALVSCRKVDDQPKVEEATFTTPALADAAVTVEFNTTNEAQQVVVSNDAEKKVVIKDIEFTEGGYAIITKLEIPAGEAAPTAVKRGLTKAGDPVEIIEIKVYTYNKETGVYEISGFATVKVNTQTKSVEVTLTSATGAPAETQTVTAETVDNTPAPQEGTTVGNLCRKWGVDNVVVTVTGGQFGSNGAGVKLKANEEGVLSLDEVAKLLKKNNVNVPNVNLEDYGVKDINFTQNGTFLINFTKADPFTGPYTLPTDKTFSYELKGEGNYIFNAKATGTLDFQKVDGVDYCFFNVNGKIENGGDNYTTKVELTLIEKK